MKTAISLPNDLFVQANLFAKNLGMSRSELFAMALREFITARQRDDLTARVNAACMELDTTLPIDIAKITRQKLLEVESYEN